MGHPTPNKFESTVWVVVKRSAEKPGRWVAHCLDLDVVSQGTSLAHAIDMIEEATMMTLFDDLRTDRNPLLRRAPREYWDELWEIVRRGQRSSMKFALTSKDKIDVLAAPVTIVVKMHRRSTAKPPSSRLRAVMPAGEPNAAFFSMC